MSAPAKFLFDVDFAAGPERAPMVALDEHQVKLAEAETAAHRRGYAEAQNDAASWERPEAVERFNPIDHVADWSVPMLVVHGGRDDRVPLDQGMGAYGAAQLRHIPSELLYFPDENHWVLKPQNSVEWYATVQAWMKKWLDAG